MYRIIDGRATGKTSRLMLIAKENNAIFVCSNPHAMERKALDYGITGLRFMSYNEFLNGARGRKDKFVVDEIEIFVKRINPFDEMIGYTLSEED